MVMWETYGISDVGKVRLRNEDAYAILNGKVHTRGEQTILRLLAVADGMGGHKAGDVASWKTISQLTAGISLIVTQELRRENFEKTMHSLIRYINNKIASMGKNEKFFGMGTTLTALIVTYMGNMIMHVGDSRAYIFHENKLRRITKDHTFVQKLLDEDEIDEDEARKHPARHELLQCIGVDENVKPDIFWIKIFPDDIVMLCSDGLTDMVDDDTIENVILKYADESLEKIAEELLTLALEAGGKDNITIVLGRLRS